MQGFKPLTKNIQLKIRTHNRLKKKGDYHKDIYSTHGNFKPALRNTEDAKGGYKYQENTGKGGRPKTMELNNYENPKKVQDSVFNNETFFTSKKNLEVYRQMNKGIEQITKNIIRQQNK